MPQATTMSPPSPSAERWAQRLRAFQALIANSTGDLEQQFAAFLRMAAAQFELENGVILRVEDGIFTVLAACGFATDDRIRVGNSFPITTSFARTVAVSGKNLASHHVSRDPVLRDHPFYGLNRPEVYLGSPVLFGKRLFGVIAMMGPAPRAQPFSPAEIALLDLMGQTLGGIMERDRLERERRIADRARREANAMLRTAFDSAPIGMALVGTQGQWLRVNRALCHLVGYTEEELLARDFQSVTHPDDLHKDLEQLGAVLSGVITQYSMEKRYIHKDGHSIWAQLSVALVREPDGTPRCFVSQILGIDAQKTLIAALERQGEELRTANDKLKQLASVDPLTHILNRRALRQRLDALKQEAETTGQPLAFLMADVDHFKAYNDAYGHMEGDKALRIIARKITEATRASDVVGRFGGEEFLVVLPGTDAEGARTIAERIRASIATCQEMRAPLTVSIGVHILAAPFGHRAINLAIAHADAALYGAKHNGRDRVEIG